MVNSKMVLIALSFLLVLFLILVPGLKAEVSEQIKKGLIFYAPMDGSITPEIAQGKNVPVSMAEWVFEDGKIGQGLKVGKGNPEVSYYSAGNMLPDRGTLGFWVKLWWDGNSDESSEYKYFFGVGGGPVVVIPWFRPEKKIFFSTFRDEWSWGPTADMVWIKAGKWHHFVFTWTNIEKKIYIDGIEQGAHEHGGLVPKSFMPGSYFSIGCHPTDKDKFADATFDEIMVWDRSISPKEIGELYKSYQGSSASTNSSLPSKEEFPQESPSIVFKRDITSEEKTLLFYKGEEVAVNLRVYNASSQSQKITAKYEVFDYHEKYVDSIENQIELPENETLKDKIIFKMSSTGIFKICVSYKTDKGLKGREEIAIFGVLPQHLADEKPPGEDSPFGIHTRIAPEFNPKRHLSAARKVGMNWVRILNFDCSTWWCNVEPEKGKFIFPGDKAINFAREYGMNLLGVLTYTPYWASSCPENTSKDAWSIYSKFPPKDIKDWERYITEVVSHYKDRIKYWEVWNEADISNSWSGTPEQYVDLLKTAYLTAKKIDPECKILGGGGLPVTTRKWIERVCESGGLDYMDIFVFHGYGEGENLGAGETGKDNSIEESLIANDAYMGRIEFFKDLMEKYGKVKPIWDTEAAVWGASYYSNLDIPEIPPLELRPKRSQAQSASELIKLYVVNLAKGVEKIFYYYMEDVTFRYEFHYHTSLLEYDGAPTSRLMAHSTLTRMLSGARYKNEVLIGKGLYCYLFERKDGAISVIWSERGKGVLKINVNPEDFKFIDIMHNEIQVGNGPGVVFNIGSEPIFLKSKMTTERLFSLLKSSEINLSEPIAELTDAVKKKKAVRDKFPNLDSVSTDRWFFIDIAGHANMGFADETIGDGKGGWSDEGSMNDMKDMPLGKQYFAGVPFNIIAPKSNNGGSCIVLRGVPGTPGTTFPEKEILKVDKKGEYLYFLHSAAWCEKNGKEIGKYIIDYADGRQEVIPLIEGQNIQDWYNEPSENEKSIAVGIGISGNIGPEKRHLRVLEWKNPFPESKILTVTFVTNAVGIKPGPTLILLSITGITK